MIYHYKVTSNLLIMYEYVDISFIEPVDQDNKSVTIDIYLFLTKVTNNRW